MARTARRYVFHMVSASVLAAALSLPTGLTSAAAGAPGAGESTTEVPAQTTPPPPTPTVTPTPTPTPTPPPSSPPQNVAPPSTTAPSSTPSGTPKPGDTSATSESQKSDDTEEGTSEPPPEQTQKIEEVTTTLNKVADEVPEALAPAVEKLTTTLNATEDPDTSPQDRQGVVESTQDLASALVVIGDSGTPRELREQLVEIVEQVTATLEVGNDPELPPEQRSMIILVVKRVTSTLHMICDSRTPEGLRQDLIAIAAQVNFALEQSLKGEVNLALDLVLKENQGAQSVGSVAMQVGSSMDIIQNRKTPQDSREELAKTTRQVSGLLAKSSDPRASQEERSQAVNDLKDRTARLTDQQEEAASAQGPPEQPLGKAAVVCTNAIFDSVSEHALIHGLKRIIPPKWNDEGVKDFWKAKEKSGDLIDVLAQLRNDEQSRAPFEVPRLITELAELLPQEKLFGTLGSSALSCQQTAEYLDEEFGITAGTWLTEAGD